MGIDMILIPETAIIADDELVIVIVEDGSLEVPLA
jgi:hypothetical protein